MSDDCGTDCQEALEKLEAYLDGELPKASVENISSHLADCYPCADRAGFEEKIRAILRRDCVDHAPETLVARIRDHLGTVP